MATNQLPLRFLLLLALFPALPFAASVNESEGISRTGPWAHSRAPTGPNQNQVGFCDTL